MARGKGGKSNKPGDRIASGRPKSRGLVSGRGATDRISDDRIKPSDRAVYAVRAGQARRRAEKAERSMFTHDSGGGMKPTGAGRTPASRSKRSEAARKGWMKRRKGGAGGS